MDTKTSEEILLEVKNLSKLFPVMGKHDTYVHAVENVSFYIKKGETLGLVGESGCGKSTLGRAILRLHEPTSGEIYYHNEPLFKLVKDEHGKIVEKIMPNMKSYRKKMQIIFQDPSASLDPRFSVAEIIGEPLDIHKMCKTKEERTARINELLNMVGLNPDYAGRYPHEFSGGQQQRVGIARALAVNPEFIVCDEPISALDVSIQSQIVNMLKDMQRDLGLTYLFIAHDLSVVKYISDRIGVMYLGGIVELTDSAELGRNPQHPYTKALLSAIPIPDPKVNRSSQRILLEGEVPSPINPPSGCRFRTRCPYATEKCASCVPELKEYEKGHWVACHMMESKG